MSDKIEMNIIARIRTDFPTKFGIPRQSGVVKELKGRIVFEPEYRNEDALRGIEGFSHLWLIWQFSENVREGWSPTVRPPILGGNTRVGVFATRSPFRPNPIGLSSVKLEGVEVDPHDGPVLIVSGADLMDGTPILDIKPYIAYADARPDAVCSYASEAPDMNKLKVEGTTLLPDTDEKDAIIAVLSGDPRPGYQEDEEREYGLSYGSYNIRFRVSSDVLTITQVTEIT